MVGVVAADSGLSFPTSVRRRERFSCSPRWREGRGVERSPGALSSILPPESYALQSSRSRITKLYEKEIEFRKTMGYPPFESDSDPGHRS